MLPDFAPSPTGLPGLELAQLADTTLHFLFLMLRIGAFILSAPLFSARFISLPVRIIITVCLTISLMGHVTVPPASDLAGIPSVVWVIRELVIGLAAGLVLQILFAAAVMAGDRIANTAGLGLAAQVDPSTGGQTPVIGQFFTLFLFVIFMTQDFHLVVIRLVLESYRILPVGMPMNAAVLVDTAMEATKTMFYDAAKMMMPAVSVLLIVNIVIGVITRSAPQLNIFAFGFPLTMTATLLLLWLTVSTLAPALIDLLDHATGSIRLMMEGLADVR